MSTAPNPFNHLLSTTPVQSKWPEAKRTVVHKSGFRDDEKVMPKEKTLVGATYAMLDNRLHYWRHSTRKLEKRLREALLSGDPESIKLQAKLDHAKAKAITLEAERDARRDTKPREAHDGQRNTGSA